MARLVIRGGRKIGGAFRPLGNKNAALPMLAACVLTDEPVVLDNVPRILDVENMLKLLADLGVAGVTLVGVAKGVERRAGHEALVLPDGRELRPGAASPALQLIQQVRDEAHRFAITGHRGKRQKARMTSKLEDIPGIGPRRRASLLKHFGGLAGLKAAGADEIARVEGVNAALAERIYANLHGLPSPEAGAE